MLDKAEKRIVDDIARVGWHVLGVLAAKDYPPFTYSIGMIPTLGHPEIVIFGLDHKLSATIINIIGKEIRGGRSFREPGLYEGLIEHFACKIHAVSPVNHKDHFGFALWHQHHIGASAPFEAVQLLWPDKAGLFPDEPGCHPGAIRMQPLL
jgi:hypothetical protein